MNALTEDERAHLRGLLELAEARVDAGLSASTQEAKPVDLELAIGRLSRVDAMQHQQMARARRDRVAAQLEQIRSALRRFDAGAYGACISCGEPIGYARLVARPEALKCQACQLGEG
ncbi:MAG: TraR/DksA C4-type zinc finger protein [Deltaproteobacteria bacterium]|nr:TraR/DksA C4-type zinc finger protein [Deltaproteobacteria bacterium]